MDQFHVRIEDKSDAVIVRLRGDATIADTESMRKALDPLIARKPGTVVLDLSELAFINSLGLGVLLEFRQKLHSQSTKIRLAGAKPQVADVFRKTRLVELFPMYADAEQALTQT